MSVRATPTLFGGPVGSPVLCDVGLLFVSMSEWRKGDEDVHMH